jgi:hypothetical protein
MSQEEEITFGVNTFYVLLQEVSNERKSQFHNIFEGEEKLLTHTLKIFKAVEKYIQEVYPTNQNKFNEFISEIDLIGKDENQEFAMKVSKYIYDYKSQGITLNSLSTGVIPTKDELRTYVISKVQPILFQMLSEFVDQNDNDDAEIALQELCGLVVMAGYSFFELGHNRSGGAINGAFTTGVGIANRFRFSDEYEELATL